MISKPNSMHGSVLLEGLIAILIFSMGVLALLGMLANSIGSISEAKYRTDAAFLANQLLGDMWANAPANPADPATGLPINTPPCPASPLAGYAYSGTGTVPAALTGWMSSVTSTLPDAATFRPIVTVVGAAMQSQPGTCGMQYTVTITVRYRPPKNVGPRQYVTTAVIS